MFALKLRFPISAPRRDDGTLLPASLVALLVASAGLQLLWVGNEPLPREAIGHVAPVQAGLMAAGEAAMPAILAQPIFSLTRSGVGAQAEGGESQPLGGAVVTGMVSSRRSGGRVFLRLPDGTIQPLRRGETYAGWQLTGWTTEAARFASGGQSISIAFGSAAQPLAAGDEASDEEESEE
jgi:hypothetical protein